MKKPALLIIISFWLSCSTSLYAYCDITRFRWDCDLTAQSKPTHAARSLVYCGNMPVYLTPEQYQILSRYHRRNINMVMKIDGEYVDAPCIPHRQYPQYD